MRSCSTFVIDVWINHTNSTTVQNPLDKSAAAVVRYTHKRRHTSEQCGRAECACFMNRQCRVLKINEDTVVTCCAGQQDYLRAGRGFDS